PGSARAAFDVWLARGSPETGHPEAVPLTRRCRPHFGRRLGKQAGCSVSFASNFQAKGSSQHLCPSLHFALQLPERHTADCRPTPEGNSERFERFHADSCERNGTFFAPVAQKATRRQLCLASLREGYASNGDFPLPRQDSVRRLSNLRCWQ